MSNNKKLVITRLPSDNFLAECAGEEYIWSGKIDVIFYEKWIVRVWDKTKWILKDDITDESEEVKFHPSKIILCSEDYGLKYNFSYVRETRESSVFSLQITFDEHYDKKEFYNINYDKECYAIPFHVDSRNIKIADYNNMIRLGDYFDQDISCYARKVAKQLCENINFIIEKFGIENDSD